MNSENIIEVDDSTWEKIIEKGEKPAVVMFYGPMCPHCREVEPYFEEYAKELRKEIIFARINVVDSSYTAGRYGVMGTPTFKFFCGGRPVQELVGAVYPPLLKKTIEEVLQHGKECIKKSTKIDYGITGYV